MSATPQTSGQWHTVTPSTRPLSLSILELTPLALTLSLTLASSSTSHLPHTPNSIFKRRKRPRKPESDDESTAVEIEDDHTYASGSIPGGWPAEVGRSFQDLLSHGVVVSVNGQPWSRIVAHASDPDPEESEGEDAEDEWEEDWEVAGGKSDEEAEEGLGAEGMQRRRPRRARFTLSAQNALGGAVVRRKEGRREKMESGKDRAVVVVYGLLPGKEYEIELRVVGMGGADTEATISNSVLIPPSPAGSLHPRSRANSLRARQHPRSRSNSTTTPAQSSSENQTPSRRSTPPPSIPAAVETIAPTPVLSAVDTQTAQMRHLVASASAEKEHLSAQIKEARRASQRAEAALRQEIDAVKKSTEKAGSLDLRAKQKALALQEQVKQGWAGAEAADVETGLVDAGMGELERLLAVAQSEVDGLRRKLGDARDKEEDVREKDRRTRMEEEKKLGEVVAKVEKLRVRKERKEAEKLELERRIEELEHQREEVERQGEEDRRRREAGHWGATAGHWDAPHLDTGHRLTTHPSLSNIGAQGGYGAGPAYRPRGAQQGYQPRFPSAGAVRPSAGATTSSPTAFYPSATSSSPFRPPPPPPAPTKSNTTSPAITNRTVSSLSSGVNASAAPFVPSSYAGSGAAFDAHHTTLMPPGMQHRIYLPSQSTQNQSVGNYQNVRPRPTPTFHPPPSVLAEQAAQAQAKNSPTTLSSPAFPPLPSVSTQVQPAKSPASAASGPSLASIVTRAVLSPNSSLSVQGSMGQSATAAQGSGAGGPASGIKSPAQSFAQTQPPVSPGAAALNRSSSPTPIPTPSSSHSSSSHYAFAHTQSHVPSGRVTFAPSPAVSQDSDFPPLSPSGPWSSLNPSIGSRVRGDSADGVIGNRWWGAGFYGPRRPRGIESPSYKRRASPPQYLGSPIHRSPTTMPLSQGSLRPGTAPGIGINHRVLLRLFIITAIVLPTLYVLLGPTVTDEPYLESMPRSRGRAEEGARGVARKVREWSGTAGKKQWFGGNSRLADADEDDDEFYEGPRGRGEEEILDLEEDLPVSVYDGGIAGYSVFSNLYLSAGSLLFVEPDSGTTQKPLPKVRQIMSGPKTGNGFPAADEDRWRVVGHEMAGAELGKRAVYLKGITYLFNDGPGGEGYLIYFQHFVVEAFLGATRVLAHILHSQNLLGDSESVPLPSRVWFPRCGWKPSWRDDRGGNAWFLAHALPGATVEDANGWDDRMTAGLPVVFERLVLVDRWSAHSVGGEVGKWGKMNADVLPLSVPQPFWAGIRKNIMRSLGVDGASRVGERGLPVVVYIDTHTGMPKIRDEDHTALIEALKGLTDIAEVHVTKISAMTKAEQVELMGRAEVVIGLHSLDLYTALWMPATDRSAIIEVFEEGGFDRSFELLASSLNHKYVVIQNDKILSEAQWQAHGAKRGENFKGHIPVDGKLVARTVRNLLQKPVGRQEE